MMQNNIKIAVTGGIGSGKSEVCSILEDADMPVLSCDKIYAELCTDKLFLNKLASVFGYILNTDGMLNRKQLSEKVFNNSAALQKLNSITHPAIMEELFKRANSYKLCFCEVPLLFENGFENLFDGVIVVLRNRNKRIDSIVKRDNLSKETAILRINNQYNYDIYDFTKYYVIHNDGKLEELKQNTLNILENIKKINL